MLSLSTAAALLLAAAPGDVVLLDFTASWCGPCQRMAPIVQQLETSGFPVRKVDYDTQKNLVQQYRITGVPTFVLLVGGREVDRSVGATSYERLAGMFAKAGARPGGTLSQTPLKETFAPAEVRSQPPEPPAAFVPEMAERPPFASDAAHVASPANDPLAEKLVASTVRIRIQENGGFGNGSGTIIDTHEGEALVLTCGHLFRDSQGKAPIFVDTFGAQAAQNMTAKLLRYDLKTDVALLTFSTSAPVAAARVAPAEHRVAKEDSAWSVGCDHGKDVAAHATRITSTRKFLGPDHYMAAGEPGQGRSGGGLFDAHGNLIGVCNAADPEDREGMYAALGNVHAIVDAANLSFVYTQNGEGAASPATATSASAAGTIVPASGSADIAPASPSDAAEVVCVVRDLTDPRAKSEVIVLDRVSKEFMSQLARERSTQGSRQPTALRTQGERPDDWSPQWTEPQRHKGTKND